MNFRRHGLRKLSLDRHTYRLTTCIQTDRIDRNYTARRLAGARQDGELYVNVSVHLRYVALAIDMPARSRLVGYATCDKCASQVTATAAAAWRRAVHGRYTVQLTGFNPPQIMVAAAERKCISPSLSFLMFILPFTLLYSPFPSPRSDALESSFGLRERSSSGCIRIFGIDVK